MKKKLKLNNRDRIILDNYGPNVFVIFWLNPFPDPESGGLKFKNWTKLGDGNSTKYLGYTWNPKEDTLKPRLWFNIGKIERGMTIEEDLTQENIEERVMSSCTKRDILSVQGQFFDPLLILSPIIVILRLFFGVYVKKLDQKTGTLSFPYKRRKNLSSCSKKY